jgi:hypothetical protein
MPWYRIYRIDDEDHAKGAAIPIESDTDQQAMEQARRYVEGLAIEVWDGPRLVGRLGPRFTAAS